MGDRRCMKEKEKILTKIGSGRYHIRLYSQYTGGQQGV